MRIWGFLHFRFLYDLYDKWILGATSLSAHDGDRSSAHRLVLTGNDLTKIKDNRSEILLSWFEIVSKS